MPKASSIQPRAAMLRDLARSGLQADARRLGVTPLDPVETKKLTKKEGCSSYKIPYYAIDGRATKFYRLRFLDPPTNFKDGKETKYWQPPGTLPALYFAPFIKWRKIARDVETTIYITEGEKKAAAACKAGLPCIGLGGVWSWRAAKKGLSLLPDFNNFDWRGREVIIVFDSDVAEKAEVQQAMIALADQLVGLGASPQTMKIPPARDGGKQGIDDLLVARGTKALGELTPEPLLGDLGRELWAMNEEFAYITNLEAVIRFETGKLINRNTLVGLTCAHRNVVIASGDKLKEVNVAAQWLAWPFRRTHKDVVYMPGKPRVTDGCVNTWPGWGVEPKKGDVSLLKRLVAHLFKLSPDHEEYFWQWMAYPLQHPGAKLYTASVLYSNGTGVGKSLVFLTLGRIYGDNFAEIGEEQLHGRNDWAAQKQFVLGDEITDTDRRRDANRIVRMITRETVVIDKKYEPVYTIADCTNYGFTTNHPDAFFLINTDRRYFIVETPIEPLEEEFYIKYDAWYRSDEGAGAVFYHLLNNVSLKGFNPHGRAPETEAKRAMIELSRSDLDTWANALREDPDAVLRVDNRPINRALWTTPELLALYDAGHERKTTGIALSKALRRAGFPATRTVTTSEGTKKLWILRDVKDLSRGDHNVLRARYQKERKGEEKKGSKF